MPLYEYRCEACGRRFEVIQKFSDPQADRCRHCGMGPVERLLSTPAIQFKGTGWYITDYAQKGRPGGESPGGDAKDATATTDAGDAKGTRTAKDSSDAKSPSASSEGTRSEAKPAAGTSGAS